MTGDSMMTCPNCGAAWPENLQIEQDMLRVDRFCVLSDGAVEILEGEPSELDNFEFSCKKCVDTYSRSAEGDDLGSWYQGVVLAQMERNAQILRELHIPADPRWPAEPVGVEQ